MNGIKFAEMCLTYVGMFKHTVHLLRYMHHYVLLLIQSNILRVNVVSLHFTTELSSLCE
jgi:hypothetical protein